MREKLGLIVIGGEVIPEVSREQNCIQVFPCLGAQGTSVGSGLQGHCRVHQL